MDAALEEGELMHLLRNLDGQFAGGAENQNLDGAQGGINLFNGGHGEGGRFARAGLGLADHVKTLHHQRDGLGLNGRGLLEAELADGF
jgi:hypothetical protein